MQSPTPVSKSPVAPSPHFTISSAYGGTGWQPRTAALCEEMGSVWGHFGINSEWAPLRAVTLYRPGDELAASNDPESVQMVEPVNVDLAVAQHDALADAYRAAGVAVHHLQIPGAPKPNQMFMADLIFMTPEGAILARPASTVRAGEERQAARLLAELGVPIVRSVSGRGTFEGADAMWLDPRTVILGRGLRTNAEGAAQVRTTLETMGVQVIQVDLPFGTMHLMGMLRILGPDLATAWPTRLAMAAVEALRARGYTVAFLPDEEEAHAASAHNYVTLNEREIIMPAAARKTRAFYEALGVRCHVVEMAELRKAAGAMGCLTGIIQRDLV